MNTDTSNTTVVAWDVVIRKMTPSDATAAAELSSELGYPLAPDAMAARLKQFAAMKDHAAFAACWQDRMVGWIDVGLVHHLVSGSYGEIGGLIVSSAYQGRGIGSKLVQAAEEWFVSLGIDKVVVRSRISREGAHTFYLRQRFSHLKTSEVFSKTLERLEGVTQLASEESPSSEEPLSKPICERR